MFVNGDYSKTPEGTLSCCPSGAISEFERRKSRNECVGTREKARQGRVLRDFQIYGYDFDAERDALVINHSEAEIVRLIFDWF